MNPPAMNSTVAALRFFFNHTVDRPDLARKLIRLRYPRKLPVVLSSDEGGAPAGGDDLPQASRRPLRRLWCPAARGRSCWPTLARFVNRHRSASTDLGLPSR